MAKQDTSYDAAQISVLKGLESVRQNVGMYVGDSDKKGLHHLVWEVVDNSVDEAMAGHCDEINIVIDKDGKTISVQDNGRGIPVAKHPTEKKSALELVLTVLHAGGKFQSGAYTASGGLHGVGLSCVNALSSKLIAEIKRNGHVWIQEYVRGVPQHKVRKERALKKGEKLGTKITWIADTEIFKADVELNDKMLIHRLQEIAFLNTGLKVTYQNKSTGVEEDWQYNGGLNDYLKHMMAGKECYPVEPIHGEDTAKLKSREGNCVVQISLAYSKEDDDEILLGFTNNIFQADGGTHISGFKGALTRAVNTMARNNGLLKDNEENLSGRDTLEGLTSIISIRFPRPEFTGQTKSKLGSTEAKSVVENVTYTILTNYFEKNAGTLKEIVHRAKVAAAARSAAKKQSDLIKRKGLLGRTNRMPGKLFDCNTNKRENSELFIVEGDSAAGSAKDGRNPETQAILPIRGKIINAEKRDIVTILKNKEIQSLIMAIGTGIRDEFDIEKLRYHKIIIMSDADDDGHHISTLLLTFFYRYMKPLVTGGFLYLAQPPLFCHEVGKKRTYCFSDTELKGIVGDGKGKVVRFKGLGEMDAEQLAETTMEPERRHLIRLSIDDAVEAERMVSVLMGSNVPLRKEHITNQVNSLIN